MPGQLIFCTARDFDSIRGLRNEDGSWLRIYFRETHMEKSYLSSLSVICEGLLRRGIRVGLKEAAEWRALQKRRVRGVEGLVD